MGSVLVIKVRGMGVYTVVSVLRAMHSRYGLLVHTIVVIMEDSTVLAIQHFVDMVATAAGPCIDRRHLLLRACSRSSLRMS